MVAGLEHFLGQCAVNYPWFVFSTETSRSERSPGWLSSDLPRCSGTKCIAAYAAGRVITQGARLDLAQAGCDAA